ncbi:hypothetical protein B0H19DRAFT_1262049 [Mycena capillaripes]|nr:hypothetical protein B0H19DRAFT_1262049 [Mycena capillaripes]
MLRLKPKGKSHGHEYFVACDGRKPKCQEQHLNFSIPKNLDELITLARAYINRASTDFFELLFDTFREIKIEATGKDLRLARFVQNGNLLVMNADMEAAQAVGAAHSLLKTNQPQFSGITTLDPAVFGTFFIKICCGHSIRPFNGFKSLISDSAVSSLHHDYLKKI